MTSYLNALVLGLGLRKWCRGGLAATASARALGEEMVATEDEAKEQQREEGHGGRRG